MLFAALRYVAEFVSSVIIVGPVPFKVSLCHCRWIEQVFIHAFSLVRVCHNTGLSNGVSGATLWEHTIHFVHHALRISLVHISHRWLLVRHFTVVELAVRIVVSHLSYI